MTNHNSNTLSSTVSSKKAATRSTSLKISHKSEMTFAEHVEAGMNPYEDILVDSLMHEYSKFDAVEFEYVAMLQLVRLNCSDYEMGHILEQMEYVFDDIDQFFALMDLDTDHSIDRHVTKNLHLDHYDLEEPIDALSDKYYSLMYDLKFQLACACDLCGNWKHFQAICKRVGLSANSRFVTDALKFARDERALMR